MSDARTCRLVYAWAVYAWCLKIRVNFSLKAIVGIIWSFVHFNFKYSSFALKSKSEIQILTKRLKRNRHQFFMKFACLIFWLVIDSTKWIKQCWICTNLCVPNCWIVELLIAMNCECAALFFILHIRNVLATFFS